MIEEFPHLLREHARRERLLEERVVWPHLTSGDVLVIAADEQHAARRTACAEGLGQLHAAHLRHHHVGDEQITGGDALATVSMKR